MNNNATKLIILFIVGLSGAAAVHNLPEHVVAIQMLLYSAMALGLPLLSLWSTRNRPRYWIGVILGCLLHAVILFFIRSYFPFQSILVVVPISISEAIIIIIVLLKICGDDEAERPGNSGPIRREAGPAQGNSAERHHC
jgi:hypothetical protein